MMLKYYPGPYNENAFLESYPTTDGGFGEFVAQHVGCSKHAGSVDLGEDNCFEVLNETNLGKSGPIVWEEDKQ